MTSDFMISAVSWADFYKKIRAMSNEEIANFWDELMHISGAEDYMPKISVFAAARAVFDEMDDRGIAPDTHLFVSKRKLNNV
ncbi:MAG: hypothetical protein GX428_09670 [Candidatus Atribacteria bacterium]|nr:hypothetical protein [Candidatus Atribacteria bacterium]